VRLARPKRPKIVCSPSYVDFRSRANAVMFLDVGHVLRGDCTQEEREKEKGRKLKT
jgi:hypothetical protein